MKLSVAFLLLDALFVHAGPQARIAGGEDAVLGQLPYQAALSVGGSFNCGAAILAERFALTALNCVCSAGSSIPWSPQLFAVSVGAVDLYNSGQRIVVEKITIIPEFNELSSGLALLRLTKPFVFNDYVSAIPLATENPPLYALIEISGWGRTNEAEINMHRTLQIGEAFVETEYACRLADNAQENDQVLCLGHYRRQGICVGDMGGPAVYQGTLVGLGAQVLGECGSMLPNRFTSIAAQRAWIISQMD